MTDATPMINEFELTRDDPDATIQPGDFHGWRNDYTDGSSSAILHIGPLPGRKSICLYKVDGSLLRVFGYFSSEEMAHEALKLISELVSGKKPE